MEVTSRSRTLIVPAHFRDCIWEKRHPAVGFSLGVEFKPFDSSIDGVVWWPSAPASGRVYLPARFCMDPFVLE